MEKHIHKRLDEDLVKFIFKKYVSKQVSFEQASKKFDLKKTRFFELLKQYKKGPEFFSIEYKRKSPKRIDPKLEKIILKELKKTKELITDKEIPVYNYNYNYLKDFISDEYHLTVSAPTIIKRAKEHDFYLPKRIKKVHDREVITDHPGELIQHDSSFHKFSPLADKKWYLITSIDDYSRYLLYAALIEKETTWNHILALESVILRFGIPFSYYTDSHSIFRFVQGRDSTWRNHKKLTDQVITQWKMVLDDLDIDLRYALSPQAKGKVERPYRWLQDRLVRTCLRKNIKTIDKAQQVLIDEKNRYNNHQVHSTTKEIPVIRLENAIKNGQSLFRDFKVPSPYESPKDIFCFRLTKPVDAYHKVSINNMQFKVKGVPLREKTEIRVVPDRKGGIAELRFWYRGKLVDKHLMKNS